MGMGSLLRGEPGLRAADIGLKVGLCRRVERQPFSRWLGRFGPAK